MASGWNPVTGNDGGPRPPLGPRGLPIHQPGQPYIPHFGPASQLGYASMYWPQAAPVLSPYGGLTMAPVGPAFGFGGYPAGGQASLGLQPNGMYQPFARAPQGLPRIDPSMPAAQLTNSTGGVGCEPGYNYFFPAQHTKVHVVKSQIPPWTLPDNAQVPFVAAHVPVNVRVGELMRGFGCDNPTPKLNRCYEVVPGGNGRWYRGICFAGDEKDRMKKSILEIGWDSGRTGIDGQKPAVWLWFTKR